MVRLLLDRLGQAGLVELIALAIGLLCVAIVPPRIARRMWRILPTSRAAQFLTIAAVATLGCAWDYQRQGIPLPSVHDEFSYLLASELFAAGQPCAPPLPFWEHFETFHVLQQPTYASKYPPAQGLVLAAGRLLCGEPIVGVWISLIGAMLAVGWGLRGALPPRWALFITLILATRAPLLASWGGTYWGGAVPLLGGALVFGATVRLLRQIRAAQILTLACGLVVLANSRPFEGLLVALPTAFALLFRGIAALGSLRHEPPRRAQAVVRAFLAAVPGVVMLAAAAAAMVWYNAQVTGHWQTMPYQVYEQQYAASPLLVWQPPIPTPTYRNPEFEKFYLGFVRAYYRWMHHVDWSTAAVLRLRPLIAFFFGTLALLCTLLAACTWWKRPPGRYAAAVILLVVAGTQCATFDVQPHYLAPAITACAYVLMVSARGLAAGPSFTRGLARVLLASLVAWNLLLLIQWGQHAPQPWSTRRAAIEHQLRSRGGQHLVLVCYSSDHNPLQEWVYNGAFPDRSPIVWARDRGAAANARLRAHFSGRQIWRVSVSPDAVRLHAL